MKQQNGFPLELVAMVAVIAISSWHVGNYMEKFDGWWMATVMGATLGFCNFLCAHELFQMGSPSKRPAFVGLIFFAVTSTWMQYSYYNGNVELNKTVIGGVNLDALFLGMWAPAAEILLGWLRASKAGEIVGENQGKGVFSLLGMALVERVRGGSISAAVRENEQEMETTPRQGKPRENQGNPLVFPNGQRKRTYQQRQEKERRQSNLQQQLHTFSSLENIPVSELAEQFNVTQKTIRNDIRELQESERLVLNGTG